MGAGVAEVGDQTTTNVGGKTMKAISKWTIVSALLAGAAYAQVPSTNDTSDGNDNTGMGTGALGGPNPVNLTGNFNTAAGFQALFANTTGARTPPRGRRRSPDTRPAPTTPPWGLRRSRTTQPAPTTPPWGLWRSLTTTGSNNTASGFGALEDNSTGSDNTASGAFALEDNQTGSQNTASGAEALEDNLTGNNNTATGFQALEDNSIGFDNTALGSGALGANTSGNDNTASGYQALFFNTTGNNNAASGLFALFSNTTGSGNTASGADALEADTTGANNIAVGFQAGINLTTGSNNIAIGNEGAAGDNKMIKIGTEGTQKKTFIAGIFSNTAVSGLPVVIGSNGELGAVSSSERFKTAIAPMGANTEKLQQLRPVTFRYKADLPGTVRYGLIAEEVAKVYPELVVRDDQGRIDGVRYDELAPMLLNELQKEHEHAQVQDAQINELKAQLAEVHAALAPLRPKDQLVAGR